MTASLVQQPLSFFDRPQTSRLVETYRKNSTDSYEVVKLAPKEYSCTNAITREPCTGKQRNGRCSHIAEFEIAELRESLSSIMRSNEYFMSRFERELSQKFHSFEAFYDWCWQGKGEAETVYLSNLFIALLYTAEGDERTTDLIHFAVGEKFDKNPKGVGPVQKRLVAGGFIDYVRNSNGEKREVKSLRESINHGSMKKVYQLTEKGKSIIEVVT
jgi:hypothetical protein